MRVIVNDKELNLSQKSSTRVGDFLAHTAAILEQGGDLIVYLSLDGVQQGEKDIDLLASATMEKDCLLEIKTKRKSLIKAKTVETCIEVLYLLDQFFTDGTNYQVTPNESLVQQISTFRQSFLNLQEALGNHFPPVLLAQISHICKLLSSDSIDKSAGQEIAHLAKKALTFSYEILSEISTPQEEMRKTAKLFSEKESELSDLPVLLQTGKEELAIQNLLWFIDLFDKTRRLLQELQNSGIKISQITIDGVALPEFYSKVNAMLAELGKAIELKDVVRLGDLTEYEILPKMKAFYSEIVTFLV